MNIQTLNTYFERSGFSVEYMIEKTHKNFEKFLSGEENPTFNQLSKISQVLSIPLGLLLLDKPIEKKSENINFRTINSEYLASQSRELQDTINEMRDKQDFLREEIDAELGYVGKFSISDNHLKVARYIRTTLGIEQDYYLKVKRDNILKFLRTSINEIGVFIFFNGKYKDNTHRALNLNEFRGFVLTDKKAPIIFINQKDTKNGQLFTLVHELVHLFIGDEEILGDQNGETEFDPTEAFVNKVTAEILVPNTKFLEKYNSIQNTEELANFFKVSEFVIVRRMLDNNKISSKQYTSLIEKIYEQYDRSRILLKEKKKSGGDFRNNVNFRIDQNFFNYVQNAVNNQKISYTDAFNIIGVSYKGYNILKESR
ncbi:ImmA/IrrE family metallo-endopeptidase [Enterococcus sp. 22-H-5-01]|uniref:ImmA/IrrE family metallo-endopeptidase n=1 Tax=Enterococcus sp. 22-H-5-01 TaxID=3418555 RepID=UPI003CFC79EB